MGLSYLKTPKNSASRIGGVEYSSVAPSIVTPHRFYSTESMPMLRRSPIPPTSDSTGQKATGRRMDTGCGSPAKGGVRSVNTFSTGDLDPQDRGHSDAWNRRRRALAGI